MSRLDQNQQSFLRRWVAVLLAVLATQALAAADPPSRVGLLNYNEGSVVFAPAGDSEWITVPLNRPLTQGDRLWADRGSRAELHAGAVAVRFEGPTHLTIVALDDRVTRLIVGAGTVQARLRELSDGDNVQLDTPNLSFRAVQAGDYRVDVNAASGTTRVTVNSGTGLAYGENGQTLALGGGQQVVFRGRGLEQIASQESPPQDSFDRWAADRDRRSDQSITARYVPREVTGHQELDSHGKWSSDPALGPVWTPFQRDAGWAPFRHGRWESIAPWGWTWIDDASWGFATSHYGRWAWLRDRWAWVPGRMTSHPVYSPALVAFTGNPGANGQAKLASGRPAVAWFPLGPGEPWKPAFAASPVYVSNANRGMALGEPAGGASAHRRPEAVTAVALADFHPGWPVRAKAQRLSAGEVAKLQVVAPPPDVVRNAAPEAGRLQVAPIAPGTAAVAQTAVHQRPAAAVQPQPPQQLTITREQVQVALQAQQSEQAKREETQRAQAQAQAQAQQAAQAQAAREKAEREQAEAAQAQAARDKAAREAAEREKALAQAARDKAAREKAEQAQAQAAREKAQREHAQRVAQAQAEAAREKAEREQAQQAAQARAEAQAAARDRAQREQAQRAAQAQAQAARERLVREKAGREQAQRAALAQAERDRAEREQAQRIAQVQAQSARERLARDKAEREQAQRAAQTQAQARAPRDKAEKQRELVAQREALQRAQTQRALLQGRAQQQAKLQREQVAKQEQARRALQAQARIQEARAQAQAKAQAQAQARALANAETESLVRHETQIRRAIGLANADAQGLRELQERREAQDRRDERERQEAQRRQLVPAPFSVSPPQQIWQQLWPSQRGRL